MDAEDSWDSPLPEAAESSGGDAPEDVRGPVEEGVGESVPLPGSAAAPAGAGRGSAPAAGPPGDGAEDGWPGAPMDEGIPDPPADEGLTGTRDGGGFPDPDEDGGFPDPVDEGDGGPDEPARRGIHDGPEAEGPPGTDEDGEDPYDPDGLNGAVDAMAGEGSGPGRKRAKARKPKKPRKEVSEKKRREGASNPWQAMDETSRQVVFTCGCITAGFCAIVLVIFGTAFVCRMFSAQPRPVIAAPDQNENVYYDAGGKMHVNVYMSQQPDTEITVYVLPDGSVTTEKPPEGEAVARTVILYVDKDGNISENPPEKQDVAPAGQPEGSPVQSSQVLYLDKEGNLAAEKPVEGPWRPVTVILGRDGSVSVVPGELQNAGTDVPDTGAKDETPGQGQEAAAIPPIILYIGTDGSVSTEKPENGDFRKYTVDFDEGKPSVVPEASAPSASEITEVPGTWDEFEDSDPDAGEGDLRSRNGDGTYVIRHGDTLTGIADELGFTVDFLAEYNNIANKNLIITGNVIRYPA